MSTPDLAEAIRRGLGVDPPVAVVLGGAPVEVDRPSLHVRFEPGRAIIGPLVVTGEPGCGECVRLRRAALGHRTSAEEPWLTAFAVQAVSAVVAIEVESMRAGRRPRSLRALVVLDLDRLTSSVHPFLPHPDCVRCRSLTWPDEIRSPVAAYVDELVGVLPHVRHDDAFGLPIARAGAGTGRGADRASSATAAVLDAIAKHTGTTTVAATVGEATLAAWLRVVGDDAFLRAWYGRLPGRRLDVNQAWSPDVRLLVARIEQRAGVRVVVLDTTGAAGVPSITTVAVGAEPAVVCATAADPEPQRACWRALTELADGVSRLRRTYPPLRSHAAALMADPDTVATAADHELLHGHPEALRHWDVLLAADVGPWPRRADPRPDGVIEDRTGPLERAAGLVAVTVTVPGTLPRWHGARMRAVLDRPRAGVLPHPLA